MKYRMLAIAALAALAVMICLAPGAGAATLYGPLYGTSTPETVAAYSTAPGGALSPVAGAPFTVGTASLTGLMAIAFTPEGDRGATSYLFGGGVRGLSVNSVGALAGADAGTTGYQSTGLAVSPDGRFAYWPTRNYGPASSIAQLNAFAISPTGALTVAPGSPYAVGTDYNDIAITPDGRNLYGSISPASVGRFSVNADGSLVSHGTVTLIGASSLQVSPDGKFLFVLGNNGVSDAIASFTIASDGSLASTGIPVTVGGTSVKFWTVSPGGSHIYVPEANSDTVTAIAVATDGSLSKIGSAVALIDGATAAVSPDGHFLFAASTISRAKVESAPIAVDGTLGAFTPVGDWPAGEAARLEFRPIQAPTARFKVQASAAGSQSKFNATATTVPSGNAAHFDWDFGDGTTAAEAGATPGHTYAKAGVYSVTVTASDEGCSTKFIYTGQSTLCNGDARASATAKLDTPPGIGRLKFRPSKFRVLKGRKGGSSFKYTLSESAKVTLTVQHAVKGRLVGKTCKKLSRKNLAEKKCKLWLKDGRNLIQKGKAGANKLKFTGRPGGKKLKPGKYRIYVVAVDSAGGKSQAKTANFTIQR